MELNPNSWYVRLFFWSVGIWGAFLDKEYRYVPDDLRERGTNLCFFVRVMVVYMPLVLLLHAAFVVAAVVSLTALPIYLFGSIAYGWTLAAIAAVIVAILGVKRMLGLRALLRAIEQERAQREKRFVEQEREERSVVTEAPKGPSFFEVLWAYLVAGKKKICPSVTFLNPQEVR